MFGALRINDDPPAGSAEAILAAAGRLFYARGLTAVVMQDIRAAAGVSLKKLYATYSSKEELVAAYLQRCNERWLGALTDHLQDVEPTTMARVRALFDWLDSWFHESTFNGCAFSNAHGELGALPESARAIVAEHVGGLRTLLSNEVLLDPEQHDAAMISDLLLLLQGAISTATLGGDRMAAVRAGRLAELMVRSAERQPALPGGRAPA